MFLQKNGAWGKTKQHSLRFFSADAGGQRGERKATLRQRIDATHKRRGGGGLVLVGDEVSRYKGYTAGPGELESKVNRRDMYRGGGKKESKKKRRS